MEAAARFRHLPKSFWADVRTVGEAVGYTLPRQNMVRSPTIENIRKAYDKLGIGTTHLVRGASGLDSLRNRRGLRLRLRRDRRAAARQGQRQPADGPLWEAGTAQMRLQVAVAAW